MQETRLADQWSLLLSESGEKNFPLLSFTFVGKKFDVVLTHSTKMSDELNEDIRLITISVQSDGERVAILSGLLILDIFKGRHSFSSLGLTNIGFIMNGWEKVGNKPNHISRLVEEVIKQLSINKVFENWDSDLSTALSDGAITMYERLGEDKRLMVEKHFIEKRPSWLVRTFGLKRDARFFYRVSKRD